MNQDPRRAADDAAYNRYLKQVLILEIVDAAFAAEIAARRSQNLMRRRFLDHTMVTTSRIALAAGMA